MDVLKIINNKFPDLEVIKAFDFASQKVCIVGSKKIKKANYDGHFLLSIFPDGTIRDFDMKIAAEYPNEFYAVMKK